MNNKMVFILVLGMMLASAPTGSCGVRDCASVDVDSLVRLMENIGPIESKYETGGTLIDEKRIVVNTQKTKVYVILKKEGSYLKSIRRSVDGYSTKTLKWTQEQAVTKATDYREMFLGEKKIPPPDYVFKERLGNDGQIWSVSWIRRIQGYQVMQDFITINFDEETGFYSLMRQWEAPADIKIPDTVIDGDVAKKAAKEYGLKLIAKNPARFRGFLLGEVGEVSKMLITPNPEFDEARLIRSIKFDPMNLRPAWVVTFVNVDDSDYKGETIAKPSSTITVWVDVETGAYLGAIF